MCLIMSSSNEQREFRGIVVTNEKFENSFICNLKQDNINKHIIQYTNYVLVAEVDEAYIKLIKEKSLMTFNGYISITKLK